MSENREHLYRKYRGFIRWEIDAAIDYAREHRNDDYIRLLLDYGKYYRQQQPPYEVASTINMATTIIEFRSAAGDH